jgi:peptidoglycan hydrolase-like protein with peptidoglycan-binding domain
MEAYSKENEGTWGSIVGFFGRTNKAVGGSIESMAAGDSAATDAAAGSGTTPMAVPVSMNPAPVAAVEPAPSAQAAAPATDASITARAQTRLQELGYSVGKADGILGPRTRGALLKFQRAKGLTESGKLDPATLRALGLA